jgi:hypothetical protein
VRLHLEQLEDRALPSSFSAATVSDLIADINAANAAGGTNTITLAKNSFDLKVVDNTTDGPTGLPVIAAGDTLIIIGNGSVIQRLNGAPAFRLFDVASGASLTLDSLTLQNGLAFGSAVAAEGGAVCNHGTLDLNGVIVQRNIAQGRSGINGTKMNPDGTFGQDAAGGGIWSSGALTLQNGTLIQNNQAIGGDGGKAYSKALAGNPVGGDGGFASGGGLFEAGGTVSATSASLSSNAAVGGEGGAGVGSGFAGSHGGSQAGGLYLTSGTLTGVTVNNNTCENGEGGGVIISGGTVSISGSTLDNNTASGSGGGLGIAGGTVILSGDTVDNNTAGSGGGGGMAVGGGVVTLTSVIVESNTTSNGWGGGIFIDSLPTVTLCGDTVQSNTCNGLGGGIFIVSGATVYIDTPNVDPTDPTVVNNNTDLSGLNGSTANIDGSYIPQIC